VIAWYFVNEGTPLGQPVCVSVLQLAKCRHATFSAWRGVFSCSGQPRGNSQTCGSSLMAKANSQRSDRLPHEPSILFISFAGDSSDHSDP
jgi:hypothetical protein